MGYLDLNPAAYKLVREVLESSFDEDDLKELIRATLGQKFVNSIPWKSAYRISLGTALDRLNSQGVLDRLLLAAAAERPDRPEVRQLSLYFATQTGWQSPIPSTGLDVPHALEQLTTSGADPFISAARLANWIMQMERQVCQVRCGRDYGSGFLVAPSLVLTNHHVVKTHLAGELPASAVAVRFDYRESPAGAVPAWDFAPWTSIDPSWTIPSSSVEQLDYAVLKLPSNPGTQIAPDESIARGWIDLSRDPPLPETNSPMFIAQHPGNPQYWTTGLPPQRPLQLSMATPGFDRVNATGTRITYKPSTLHGSSGSPVADRTLRTVALHHAAGSDQPDIQGADARTNEGIPLAAVRAALPEDVRQLLVAPPARVTE